MTNDDLAAFASDFLSDSSEGYFDGSLNIFGDVSTVANLEGLRHVTGDLTIMNSFLETLEGLQGLERVDGDLVISYNPDLMTLEALAKLIEVNGTLDISYNDKLSSLAGLTGIQKVNGNLVLTENGNLTISDLRDISQLKQLNDIFMSFKRRIVACCQKGIDWRRLLRWFVDRC